MKGITPIIAIILLLLITVSIAGVSFIFMERATRSSTEAVEESTQQLIKQGATQFALENVGGNKIYVRNRGSQSIAPGYLTIYMDNRRINVSLTTPLQPGELGELVLPKSFSLSRGGTSTLKLSGEIVADSLSIDIALKSCKGVLESGLGTANGLYNITANGADIEVYCDLTTDGGGWTLAVICKPDNPCSSPGSCSSYSSCYSYGAVGSLRSPVSGTSAKLSDDSIKSILVSGDNLTRTWWRQQYRLDLNNPVSAAIFNRLTNPMLWNSTTDYTALGKEFFMKYSYLNDINADMAQLSAQAYAMAWSAPIYTTTTGCAGGSHGWSNTQQDSCGFATWYAGCETGPSMSHCCACVVYNERANLIVWVR